MRLTRPEFEERGETDQFTLSKLIALLSKPIECTILISNER